jgi:acetolactate synthase I/II/III large subunit
LNNHVLGWVYHGQGERPIASRFAQFNYSDIATAMGCAAFRVSDETELRDAIPRALAAGKPAVIEVLTSLDDSFQDAMTALVRPK